MPSLRELQTQFLEAVKGDGPVDDLPVFETNGIAKETRMGIYRYAYWNRIESSLAEDFPRTDSLLANWPFTFEDLVHDFMMLEKHNFASIGELSKAFYFYVLSADVRLNSVPASEAQQLLIAIRTDYLCLMSELTPWNLLFREYTANAVSPVDMVNLESDEINILWNSSLYIFDTILVFQYAGSTKVVEYKNGNSRLFELLGMRRQIQTFDQLLHEMSALEFDEISTTGAIQFLCENEILFFTRRAHA